MSDDTKPASPSSAPTITLKPSGPVAPVIIMKGGTQSGWMDKHIAAQKADHATRLAQADNEKAEAAKGFFEDQDGVQGAVRKSVDLGQPHHNPVAILQIVSKDGKRERFIQADVTEATSLDGKGVVRVLVLVCPDCHARGIPQAQCQLTIRDDNRKWYLNEATKDTPFRDPDTGDVYMTAGTVECPEACRCPQPGCTWKFRISSKSDHPGVSRIVRE